MKKVEVEKTAGRGPGREDAIELTAEDGTNGKHAHYARMLRTGFVDQNLTALAMEPTPYTQSTTRQVHLPSDERLLEILDNV